MGLNSSKLYIPENAVFHKELNKINFIVNQMLSENNIFKSSKYNMFLKGKCDEFTVLNAKKLYKYPKMNIDNINSSIFIIPNSEVANTKKQLCNKISIHYTRMLQIIYLIKYIYDLENFGDKSIGGIIMRNIQIKENLVEISYCETKQEEPYSFNGGVNFSNLAGFDMFVNTFLSKEESKNFLGQFQEMLTNYNKKKLKKFICKDVIVNNETHNKIHNTTFQCFSGGGQNIDQKKIMLKVTPYNPIFSWNLCLQSKKRVATYNRRIINSIRKLQSTYKENFSNMISLLNEIIQFNDENQTYELKLLTSTELDVIEKEIKKIVILFFMQSIVEYKNVFNTITKYSVTV